MILSVTILSILPGTSNGGMNLDSLAMMDMKNPVNFDREPLHKTQAFIGLSASSTIGHPLRAMKLIEIDEVNKKRKMEDKGRDLFL